MIEITLKRHFWNKENTILLYDSIENLPIEQFSKMQKYQMIENGIGKNIAGFDTHLKSAIQFLKHKETDKAIKEISNLRHLFYHTLNEVDPSHLSFCCLVCSINGEEILDYSEGSLDKMRKRLSDLGLTQKIVAEQAVKKNSKRN